MNGVFDRGDDEQKKDVKLSWLGNEKVKDEFEETKFEEEKERKAAQELERKQKEDKDGLAREQKGAEEKRKREEEASIDASLLRLHCAVSP